MNRGRKLILNTILLTITAFIMRGIGMLFQIYLSRKIGAAGLGLFQLIMSVYMLFMTIAISGIRFATTRLVSEELGVKADGAVGGIVRKCLIYALAFGTAAAAALYFLSDLMGLMWIKDTRSVLSLRILSISLPFLAMSSVLSGYFTAVCRVIKSAAAQFVEQVCRILIVMLFFSMALDLDTEHACAVIVAGGVAGDFVSFAIQYTLYLFDKRRYRQPRSTGGITVRMLGISLPLAFSSYARTALSTLQQILIPRGFEKSGATAHQALSDYGTIHGMVFPVITLPSALFTSLSEIIVPELTDAQVKGDSHTIEGLVGRILRLCTVFSLGVAAVLFRYSGELGQCIFGDGDVGKYMRILSLLMPVMYLDSVTDGMLRGLGQHMHSMWYNIADSVISLILVYVLLPKWAVAGYIFIIFFTEVFNFALSINRLAKVAKFRIGIFSIFKALVSSLGSVNIAMVVLRAVRLPLAATPLSVTAHILLTLVIYFFLLGIFRCIDSSDKAWFKSVLKKR